MRRQRTGTPIGDGGGTYVASIFDCVLIGNSSIDNPINCWSDNSSTFTVNVEHCTIDANGAVRGLNYNDGTATTTINCYNTVVFDAATDFNGGFTTQNGAGNISSDATASSEWGSGNGNHDNVPLADVDQAGFVHLVNSLSGVDYRYAEATVGTNIGLNNARDGGVRDSRIDITVDCAGNARPVEYTQRDSGAFEGTVVAAPSLAIVPGADGYGVYGNIAGRGGTVIRVTNLNDSGTGSLRDACAASGPRNVVFDVSGTIVAETNIRIDNDNIRIMGQTAPSPGITIKNSPIRIEASHVLVQHIRSRPGEDTPGHPFDSRDCFQVAGGSNIVLDHCTMTWAIDENIELWGNPDLVTIRYCLIAEGLLDSLHSKGNHSMGLLTGGQSNSDTVRVSITHNMFAHNDFRHPFASAAELEFVNNYIWNAGQESEMRSQLSPRETLNWNVVNNIYVQGPDHRSGATWLIGGSDQWPAVGSQLYLSGNVADDATPTQWDMVSISGSGHGLTQGNLEAASPPVPLSANLNIISSSGTTLRDHLSAQGGARATDRDAVDTRIVNEIVTETGVHKDDPAAGGGYPTLAQNVRVLALPTDHTLDSGNGYTNLEVWAEGMAAELEGRTSYFTPETPAPAVDEEVTGENTPIPLVAGNQRSPWLFAIGQKGVAPVVRSTIRPRWADEILVMRDGIYPHVIRIETSFRVWLGRQKLRLDRELCEPLVHPCWMAPRAPLM